MQYQLEGEAGFQEWLSDQIAVFLTNETKQAKNQTESFFKNIASKIKAFFTKYAAVAKRRFTSDPVFNDYTSNQSYLDRLKKYDNNMKSYYIILNIIIFIITAEYIYDLVLAVNLCHQCKQVVLLLY